MHLFWMEVIGVSVMLAAAWGSFFLLQHIYEGANKKASAAQETAQKSA